MVSLRALCNYAREKHAAPDGTPTILAHNPVTRAFGVHKLGKLHRIKARDERIPADKIGSVWAMLQRRRAEARTVDDRTSADYVCMLLLTGLRAGECARLLWENVNLEEGWFRKEGDTATASLYLSRVEPPMRPKAERVTFKLDTTLPTADQAAQVVQAVADGDLSPDDGLIVMQCIATYIKLKESDELEARLRALEMRPAGAGSGQPRGGVAFVDVDEQGAIQ